MHKNPLKKLHALGQSIWLDYIKRDLMESGKLKKLIDEDDLRGMTSNPSLFEQVISKSDEYDADIKSMSKAGKNVNEIYEALTIKDVQDAADIFRALYNKTEGQDGYVSLEVNPHLAYDTAGTIDEARRLWKILNRANVFIKVPATKEGMPAIQQLISEGINVNVTLLFGLQRYREVAQAYIEGIKMRLDQKQPVHRVASVASFFLSRIDVMLDPIFEKCMTEDSDKASIATQLRGEIAIASARLAYLSFGELFENAEFQLLEQKSATVQRLLWASTGTKNPDYSDIKYIEALIGSETVNTVPLETLDAYRNHGDPAVRIGLDLDRASWTFDQLPQFGIDMNKVTQQLEDEGVTKFIKAYDQLIETLKTKAK